MTMPAGDQPDWQTLVSPQIVVASIIDQANNLNSAIFQSTSPFRVWGVWVRGSAATAAAYAGGVQEIKTRILDGFGNAILEVAFHVIAANQIAHAELAIPLNGFTPAIAAGFYTIDLNTDPELANTFYKGSGGIFYSQP